MGLPAVVLSFTFRALITMQMGPSTTVDDSAIYARHHATDSTTVPLTGRFGMIIGTDDWAIDLMGRSSSIDRKGHERSMVVFEPAFRHEAWHAGPLHAFARAEGLAGKIEAIWAPGPCTEEGECQSLVTPGQSVLGLGLGAGLELGGRIPDGGWGAITAMVSVDVASIGGDVVRMTTWTIGVEFGSMQR